METTIQKTVANSKPCSQQPEGHISRFFHHAFSSIPSHATIIKAKAVQKEGIRSLTFTYGLDGEVFTKTFKVGGQES